MSTQIKIVCPKCKARLKIPSEKIAAEIVKFKCPRCESVLRIKKPLPHQEISRQSPKPAAQETLEGMEQPGRNLTNLEPAVHGNRRESPGGQVKQPEIKNREKSLDGPERGNEDVQHTDDEETGSLEDYKRAFDRVKFNKKVLVDNQIMVEALDISENGLFLHTGRSFDLGSIISVAIPTAPGSFDLKLQARVQHNHRGIGMGLMFVDVDDIKRAKLQKLIDSLDAAAHQELEGRMRILLVGGSDTARNIIKSKLVLDGFYVMQATNVAEVQKVLQHEKPDAIVLDWQETSFNCRGLFYQIKENSRYDDIVTVVLSTQTDPAIQKEIIDAGADRYMAKMDASPAKLSQILKKLIEERKG